MKKFLAVLIAGVLASSAYAADTTGPSCNAVSVLAKSFAEDRNAGVKYMDMRQMIANLTAKNRDHEKARIISVSANKIMDAIYKDKKYNQHQTPAQIGDMFYNECSSGN